MHEAPAPALHERGKAEVAAARKRYGLPPDYLLWVGGLQTPDPRKRIAALARAPRELPLVLVGATRPWAHELPDVTLTGHVSDDELAAIYSGAHALVFPSDDEGFGLPTVEALACGTPVVASDLPVLREVLGDRATFVATGDLEGLLAAGVAATRPAPDAAAVVMAGRGARDVAGVRGSGGLSAAVPARYPRRLIAHDRPELRPGHLHGAAVDGGGDGRGPTRAAAGARDSSGNGWKEPPAGRVAAKHAGRVLRAARPLAAHTTVACRRAASRRRR